MHETLGITTLPLAAPSALPSLSRCGQTKALWADISIVRFCRGGIPALVNQVEGGNEVDLHGFDGVSHYGQCKLITENSVVRRGRQQDQGGEPSEQMIDVVITL